LPYTKVKSKWIKDLNVRPKTLKLLEENIEKTIQDTGRSKDGLNRTPIAQKIIAGIDKWVASN
jgi:hypothetical protein